MPNAYGNLIKSAVEGYWTGKKDSLDVLIAEVNVNYHNSKMQTLLDLQPVSDIDVYDRMLKTAVMFGLVPKRFGPPEHANKNFDTYFSIPRGTKNASASPMVKWFNTNYHVIQPEIEHEPELVKKLRIFAFPEKKKMALIGPWTLLSYSINKTDKSKEQLFAALSEEYVKLINHLPHVIVQLEEPSFITHGMPVQYTDFAEKLELPVHLHVYFGAANAFAQQLFALPVQGIGLDFIDGPANLELLSQFPANKILIAGVISGRNVWKTTKQTQKILDTIIKKIPDEKLFISPSCPLLHVPLTVKDEKTEIAKKHFSFAVEKLQELEAIRANTIKYASIQEQNAPLPTERFERKRKTPWVSSTPYPTTTIGSFPQTKELRNIRSDWKKGKIPEEEYKQYVRNLIKECIAKQEELDLDVLVHGEFERSDMVEYFAEQLNGFTTINSRIQSYGTRQYRPPVITGTVSRPKPMTVEWTTYAQSLTKKPVKGMLTGPVTMTQWSFQREDISKEAQMYEIARALAEEVEDLVSSGITHIQIDEPALREGLPLDPAMREHYLHHAVNAFRLVFANVPNNVVIHSHMCFSEFSEIMHAINDMGVDVLSIEDSKAKGKTAHALQQSGFSGSIGLGVYDVHSPRIPLLEEMLAIPSSLPLDPRKIWINPDCGLKTRGQEAYEQLEMMIKAAKKLMEV